jgi:hypothetical protein
MADLIIIAYDSEEKAEAARNKVLELQKEYLIEIGDAVVAVRRDDGHIKLNQLVNTLVGANAISISLWAFATIAANAEATEAAFRLGIYGPIRSRPSRGWAHPPRLWRQLPSCRSPAWYARNRGRRDNGKPWSSY